MIDVSRGEGRFKQIGVRVKNAPFEVSDIPYHRHPRGASNHQGESISLTRASIAEKPKEL
jgi:hypothetical protein